MIPNSRVFLEKKNQCFHIHFDVSISRLGLKRFTIQGNAYIMDPLDKIVEVNKHSVLALDSESNNHISYVTHIQTKSIHMKEINYVCEFDDK